MTGGTENAARTTMRKTITVDQAAEDGDEDVGPSASASAAGSVSGESKTKDKKGAELKKALGSMFDSMVPLKSSKKSRRDEDRSDDSEDGKGKRRRGGGRGGGGGGPARNEDPEARNWHLSDFSVFQ